MVHCATAFNAARHSASFSGPDASTVLPSSCFKTTRNVSRRPFMRLRPRPPSFLHRTLLDLMTEDVPSDGEVELPTA